MDRENLIKQWEESGYLDELKPMKDSSIVKLYESKTKQLLNEVDSGKEFPSVFPIARRFLNQLPNEFDFVYGTPSYEIDENRIMF